MNREQATFGIGGVAFGFMAGFVLAYAFMAPTTVGHAPTPPARAGNPAGIETPPTEDAAPHGDVMALLGDLNRRLEENPNSIEVLLELAHLYLRAAMTEQAAGYLDRVEEIDPGNFQGLMYRAMALEGAGQADDAQKLLERLLAEHPDHWETHYLTAIHYMTDSRDLVRARQAIERLESLKPGIPVLEDLRREMEHLEGHPGAGDRSERSG